MLILGLEDMPIFYNNLEIEKSVIFSWTHDSHELTLYSLHDLTTLPTALSCCTPMHDFMIKKQLKIVRFKLF